MFKDPLPSLPSELLEVALQDLAWAERQKSKYVVNMDIWHEPLDEEDVCVVCLSGSVMARSLKCDPRMSIDVEYIDRHNSDLASKLIAIDCFREGFIHEGLEAMSFCLPNGLAGAMEVTPYLNDRKKFKADMRYLIKLLRFHGL